MQEELARCRQELSVALKQRDDLRESLPVKIEALRRKFSEDSDRLLTEVNEAAKSAEDLRKRYETCAHDAMMSLLERTS